MWECTVCTSIYLDFALSLHHLEFGLGQLLFQLPHLSPEGLLLLVLPPPLGPFSTLALLALALFGQPVALWKSCCGRGWWFISLY